jgi:glucokinase
VILAIDVGGTKTLAASMDDSGAIAEQIKFETPHDYAQFVDELIKTVQALQSKSFTRGVIAMPGKIDRTHGIALSFGNLPWTNIPIKKDLETALGIPFLVENDANLAGLSEAQLLPDYRKVLYLTVSTGIGGVLVVNRKIDHNSLDAEYGHMLLEYEGRLERWEHFASGRAIFNKYHKKAFEITDPSDWYQIARNIAIGLIDVIAITTPDIVVIGGGVGSHFDKYADR